MNRRAAPFGYNPEVPVSPVPVSPPYNPYQATMGWGSAAASPKTGQEVSYGWGDATSSLVNPMSSLQVSVDVRREQDLRFLSPPMTPGTTGGVMSPGGLISPGGYIRDPPRQGYYGYGIPTSPTAYGMPPTPQTPVNNPRYAFNEMPPTPALQVPTPGYTGATGNLNWGNATASTDRRGHRLETAAYS